MEKLILWQRLAARPREDASEPGVILGWARTVRARLVAGGGEILAQISGTVVAAFDETDASDVLEVALELCDAADRESVAVAIGIALGVVEEGAGRAVEVAELLATRAQTGEVVLDPAARELVEGLFLFGRQVSTGVGGPRGSAIDRAHPRRDALGEGIARLGPTPISPITAELVPELVSILSSDPPAAVVLRGPVGAGAVELVAEAAARVGPRVVVGIGSAPGGIVPLASLRYGLARALGSDDAIVAACGAGEAGRIAGETLRGVLRGALPALDELVDALSLLFAQLGAGGRPWVFLSPLTMVDAASLEALLAARERGAEVALIARYPVDARLPAGIAEPLHEMMLPPLRTSDARTIAESVLGALTDPELARRVAVLGGETPLGVLEVARALIASGDLVPDEGGGFVWRASPRGGATAIPLEEVVSERLEQQDDETRRTLEAVCVAPDGASRDLVEAIAARDGLVEKARHRALDRLGREAWLASSHPDASVAWPSVAALEPSAVLQRPQPSSNFVRRVVLAGMPPPRLAELHRFVAEALLERGADDPALASMSAELGFFEIEGGLEARGVARLAAIGRVAVEQGYRRAASRIGTLLARLGSGDADALARAAATVPPPAAWDDEEAPPSTEIALDELERDPRARDVPIAEPITEERLDDRSSSFAGAAEAAIRARDLESLDRLVERAVASGSDMAAVARFRALADLLRGDVGGARLGLAKARGYGRGRAQRDPRESLAEAAVALGGGDASVAVRLGLRALALARRAADPRGEHAALRTLGACYRALGREQDAATLERATR